LIFFIAGTGIFFIFGSGPVSYFLLSRLEFQYSALNSIKNVADIDSTVVLTGYAVADTIFPLSSRVNDATIFRLSEAIRLWRKKTSTKIILAGPGNMTRVMKELLVEMGVEESQVIQAKSSTSTTGNAESVRDALSGKKFFLVTSAGHMPRAMMLFEQAALHPLPAPTDYNTTPEIFKSNLLPTPFHLKCSDLAVHEYLAIAYYAIYARSN
jgi:uncharacterized SAM-binding protein YcdF (DUF218 family)